ncbi:MAG: hypothetical protein ABW215_09660 [Kibdelosporangium sp.]
MKAAQALNGELSAKRLAGIGFMVSARKKGSARGDPLPSVP